MVRLIFRILAGLFAAVMWGAAIQGFHRSTWNWDSLERQSANILIGTLLFLYAIFGKTNTESYDKTLNSKGILATIVVVALLLAGLGWWVVNK